MENTNFNLVKKIEISDFKLFDYFDLGEHEYLMKSVNRTFFLNELGLKKRKIREKWPKLNQKWTFLS